jgi:hypothetical protein
LIPKHPILNSKLQEILFQEKTVEWKKIIKYIINNTLLQNAIGKR